MPPDAFGLACVHHERELQQKGGVCFLRSLCSFVLSVLRAFIGLMHAFPYSNVRSKYSSLSHPGQASPCRCRSSSHLPTQGAAVHPPPPCHRAFPLRLPPALPSA